MQPSHQPPAPPQVLVDEQQPGADAEGHQADQRVGAHAEAERQRGGEQPATGATGLRPLGGAPDEQQPDQRAPPAGCAARARRRGWRSPTARRRARRPAPATAAEPATAHRCRSPASCSTHQHHQAAGARHADARRAGSCATPRLPAAAGSTASRSACRSGSRWGGRSTACGAPSAPRPCPRSRSTAAWCAGRWRAPRAPRPPRSRRPPARRRGRTNEAWSRKLRPVRERPNLRVYSPPPWRGRPAGAARERRAGTDDPRLRGAGREANRLLPAARRSHAPHRHHHRRDAPARPGRGRAAAAVRLPDRRRSTSPPGRSDWPSADPANSTIRPTSAITRPATSTSCGCWGRSAGRSSP